MFELNITVIVFNNQSKCIHVCGDFKIPSCSSNLLYVSGTIVASHGDQARSQDTIQVEALLGRGFGGLKAALNGSMAKPWWGPRGEAPGSLWILHIYSAVLYVKNDPLFIFLLHDFTCDTIALEANGFYTFTVQFSIR